VTRVPVQALILVHDTDVTRALAQALPCPTTTDVTRVLVQALILVHDTDVTRALAQALPCPTTTDVTRALVQILPCPTTEHWSRSWSRPRNRALLPTETLCSQMRQRRTRDLHRPPKSGGWGGDDEP
jgi:hypothetical protein